MSRDHEQYEENLGAYLLGALTELESEVFEKHVATCALCRQEFEELRVASEALPRAVEPVVPPASLKKSLMEIVTAEASESIEQVARHYVHGERMEEGMLNRVSAVVRAYDPCLSCSTHAGGIVPMRIELVAADGRVVDAMASVG